MTFTLIVDLSRLYPIVSMLAALGVGAVLYTLWVRAGGPRGDCELARRGGGSTGF